MTDISADCRLTASVWQRALENRQFSAAAVAIRAEMRRLITQIVTLSAADFDEQQLEKINGLRVQLLRLCTLFSEARTSGGEC